MFNISRRVPWVPHDLALHVRNVVNLLGGTGSIRFFDSICSGLDL